MLRGIRWRITIPYVLLTLVVMTGLGIHLSSVIKQNYLNDLERSLTAQARLLSDVLTPILMEDTHQEDNIDKLAQQWGKSLESRVTIIASDGVVLGESVDDRTQMDNHLKRPEIQHALANGQGSIIRRSATVGYEMMYVAVPIQQDDEFLGYARVALSIEQIDTNRVEYPL